MSQHAMFDGLVIDESDNLVAVKLLNGEAFYVVDDAGFMRHIEAEKIDREVVTFFIDQLKNNKNLAVDQAMRMTGQDDIFSKAALDSQIENINVEDIVGQILPIQAREMLGMLGFRIVVNYRGDIVRLDQPNAPDDFDPDDF